MTSFWPIRLPAWVASAHGTPSRNAIGENAAQQPLQRQVLETEPRAGAGQDAVDQVNKANKGDQHRADGQGNLQAGHCAVADRFEDVYWPIALRDYLGVRPFVLRLCFRHDHLGDHQRARCRHEARRDQVLQLHAHLRIAHHYGPCDRRAAAGHDSEQLRLRHAGQVRLYDERRVRVANEDVRHRRYRFGVTGLQQFVQPAAEYADDPLHDAEVVEN